MSEKLGPRVFGHDRGQPFLGREFSSEPDYSDEIARDIDGEIRRIVESAHQTAKGVLNEKNEELERISKLLLVRETIDAGEFAALLEGKPADEVFRDDEEEPTGPAEPAEPEPERARPAARPNPRPRPGFAGGDAS
jgi:cell division protease FtsH